MGTANQPWWETDPDVQEHLRRSQEQLEHELEALAPLSGPQAEPSIESLSPRACLHQLRRVRGELEQVQARYEKAVLAARNTGLSWAQIGDALGVSKQNLHSRFRARDHSTYRSTPSIV